MERQEQYDNQCSVSDIGTSQIGARLSGRVTERFSSIDTQLRRVADEITRAEASFNMLAKVLEPAISTSQRCAPESEAQAAKSCTKEPVCSPLAGRLNSIADRVSNIRAQIDATAGTIDL